MNFQRKKPTIRLFRGLVGLQSEETPEPKTAITSASPTQSVTEIQAQIISEYDKTKRKRGRPTVGCKAMTAVERKQRSRARQAEASAKKAVNQEYLERISGVMHKHRDSAGRLHGESSGGDAVAAALNSLEVESGQVQDGGGRVSASGTDPHVFESGGYRGVRETLSQWANRQNFYAPAKWNAGEKEGYAEELARQCCVEEFYCKFGDFSSPDEESVSDHFCAEHYGNRFSVKITEGEQPEITQLLPPDYCIEKYRCVLGDVIADKYDDMINHFLRDHKGYIRSMIRFHEPRIIKTPRTFSTRDPILVTESVDNIEKS